MDKKQFNKNWPINRSGQIRPENSFVSIYRHTVEYCIKSKFPVYKPLRYKYDDDEFKNDDFLSLYVPYNEPAKVFIENIDSFDMARKIKNTEEKVLVLNLASDRNS